MDALRNLDLLLMNPLEVALPDGFIKEGRIQVAHPLPYVLQKGLILPSRPKDDWYVWDVANIFPAHMAAEWLKQSWTPLTRQDRERLRTAAAALEARFADANAIGVQNARSEWDMTASDLPRPAATLVAATVRNWLSAALRLPMAELAAP